MPSPSPNRARLHLESGLRAQAQGDASAAAAAYGEALRVAPEHPDALNLMGTALLQLGHADQAVDHLARAARKMKDHPGVHGNLGQACVAAGRYEQARAAFRKASRLEPGNVYYQLGTATALALHGKLGEAETLLRNQARRFATEPLVWLNLGNVLRDLGKPAEALDCFNRTLNLDPAQLDARNNRGGVLHALERFDEAERDYRDCIEAAPDYTLARCNLALLLTAVGRFGEAESVLRQLIELAPDLNDARVWLGAALNHQGRIGAAMACFLEAAQRDPRNVKAAQACASTLMEHGRSGEGLRWFTRALALEQSDPRRAGFCYALLAEGRVGEGWGEHDSRAAALRIRAQSPTLQLARELPGALDGKHVCLLREQGLGDEIFFLRFARELKARGARVSYRASGKLRGMLMRTSFLDDVLEENAPLPQSDATLLIGDLPRALTALPAFALPAAPQPDDAPSGADFAQRIAVFWPPLPPSIELSPLAERVTEMRERLARAGPPPYLGVTWRAGTPPHLQKGDDWVLHKAVDPVALAGAVRGFSGTVVALQRRPEPAEFAALNAALARPMHDFCGLNDDLEGMLALLAVLDEYVGVSNTNMHLRAAAGKTARVLVPRPAEWRWLRAGRTSPWFPGFAIYRQSLQGDWGSAVKQLSSDLLESLGKGNDSC